ncbi:unnamed protein product [Nezara viridula]|uniref:Uncharacterized protein n=1 Tax=Nezara viridula TaxID=85310 RepID=A0A9P0HI64_NEZVI|nr:unnamed protein product [Nezara viridula]
MLATLAIQILLSGVALGDVSEKLRLGLLPSSSNYPGLLTPLESAAATPVQKTLHSNRRHDEDNLERLCNDPFHSFLCKPVTVRRRRINGRLRPGAVIPSGAFIQPGIVPEASNVQESSQLLESNSDLVRQGKSYLPPIEAEAPKKLIEPQYLPPGSFKTSELSNVERTQESKISYATSPKNRNGLLPDETEKTPKKVDQPQNYGQKPRIEPDNRAKNSKQIQLNKLPRNYLPIDESVSPDSSNLSPSIQNLPLQGLAAQNRERKDESHSLERLCNDPFHSFLCKPGKRRKRIDGRLRPEAKIPPSALIASSSIVRESRVLPSQPRSVRQPSNTRGARDNYLPPNQDKPQSTYQNQQTYIPPQDTFGYNYPKPSNNGTIAVNNGYSYEKPSNTLPDITTVSPSQISNTLATSPQADISQDIVPPSSGYQYVPPPNGLTVTTIPPLTTQTLLPNADGTSIQETVNSGGENGYYYPKPSSAASTTVVQTSPYSTAPPQESTDIPTGTVGGYNYPKPSNPLTLPSTTFLTTTPRAGETTTKTPSYQSSETQTTAGGYTYPKPSNNKQKSGYNYEKPSVEFTLPAAATNPATNTIITQTTPPPVSITTESPGTTFGYQYPKPSNTQENIVSPNQTGYAYPKPSISLTYPTTQRPETTKATSSRPTIVTTTRPALSITTDENPTTGYQYPKPTINQDIAVPSSQSGYNYPKPSVGFTYPSAKQPETADATQTVMTTTIKPELETSSIQNIPAASQTGYVYEKPSNSLTLPTKKPSTYITQSSEATNINQDIVPPTQEGYVYEKPTYSTTVKPASTQTVPAYITTISNLQTTMQTTDSYQYPKPSKNPFQDGYQYPKPAQPFPPQSVKPSTLETTQTFITNPTTQQSTTEGYQYPKPSNEQMVESPSQNGYVYEKPEISFTLPNSGSETSVAQTIQTTTSAAATSLITTKLTTGYEYPNPSNIQNDVLTPPKQSGYTYPKPSSSFTYPSTTVPSYPTVEITTNVPTTTKPTTLQSQSTENVQKEQTGYNYEKPPQPFTYPRPTFSTTSYTRPLNSFQYPKPNFPQAQGSATQNGYTYQRPVAPTPLTADQGYHYGKPSNPLSLPPRQRSARNYRRTQQYPTRRDFGSFIF